MKRIIAVLVCLMLIVSACSVKTKSDVAGESPDTKPQADSQAPVPEGKSAPKLSFLTQSSQETVANVVRDQLTKLGIEVEMNIQPDYSSFASIQDSGNFDIALTGWGAPSGNPDYNVRGLFYTGGAYNTTKLSDPEVDALIDKAAGEIPEVAINTYKELEQMMVEGKAYYVPLYSSIKAYAFNKELIDPDSVVMYGTRTVIFQDYDYNDQSLRDTQPFITHVAESVFDSFDPIKTVNVSPIHYASSVVLINLSKDTEITTEDSLSRSYAVADGNLAYYFLLRDDINFCKVVDRQSVDTGERVGAEDVVFSINRAKDKDSVPDQRVYNLFENIDTVEIVTDMAELENTAAAAEGTVRQELEKAVDTPISELIQDKTQADNQSGKYQVVKITTKEALPQTLNFLAHPSGGIVSESQVSAVNTYDISTYDRTKDVAYGDDNKLTEGPDYDNTLYSSGPYIILYKNDYEIVLQRNPNYMNGTAHEPKIKNVVVKVIADKDAQLSALRSGDVHLITSVPDNKVDIVNRDSKLQIVETASPSVYYLEFSLNGTRPVEDMDLRKAVLYGINQEEIIKVLNGRGVRRYSLTSPVALTDSVLNADAAKAAEFLKAYMSK